ncbi:MAG: hypothetical protein LIP03_06925 [Bacteroidales bacterium]|nr:hypothetical protein [Bacteroidales bacterium]
MENDKKILGTSYNVFNWIWIACFVAVCVLIFCSVLSETLGIIFFGVLLLTAIISVAISSKRPYKGWNTTAWISAFCALIGLFVAIFFLPA